MIDEVLSSLCALPHRYSTSPNEHRAAEYLRQKLSELGVEAHQDPFVAPTTFSWIYFILYLGFLLAVVSGPYNQVIGLLFAVGFAVLFYGEQTSKFSALSRWVPGGLSHNVTGRVPARGDGSRKLVLVAHYDTSKTSLMFHPSTVKNFRVSFMVSLVMIGLILAGSLARFFSPAAVDRVINWALIAPGAYMAISCLLMVEREVRGVPVNGAADNASGVAVVIELVKRIKEQGGLSGYEVIALLTGSEEVGLTGMAHFISGNGRDLDPETTVFLNFDNLGGGRLHFIRAEGMLWSLPADPELLKIAEETAKNDPRFSEVTGAEFRTLTLDSLVPASRGFRVLSLMGLNEHMVPTPWHWFDDTLENMDRDMPRLAADFGWEIINRLVSGKNNAADES
jgi:hypothetical protein